MSDSEYRVSTDRLTRRQVIRAAALAGGSLIAGNGAGALLSAAANAGDKPQSSKRKLQYRFPEGFLWGAATSAYQVEGSPLGDGAGVSIWHRFAHTPGNVANDDNGDIADDHYHRFREDVAIMRDIGLKAYHFSTSWARVIPEGTGRVNERGLDFYDKLVDALVAAGISPNIVLYAWEMPAALQDRGGWANRDSTEWFADFAAVMFKRLGNRVEHWLTMCEPMSIAHYGHVVGALAPGMRDIYTGLRVAHHLLVGHGRVVQTFRRSGAKGKIGLIQGAADIQPASQSPADIAAAKRTNEHFNALFLDPIMWGQYPADTVKWWGDAWPAAAIAEGDLKVIATPIDFIGIDYYCRSVVADDPGGHGAGGDGNTIGAAGPLDPGMARMLKVRVIPYNGPVTGVGWPITPDGLANCLLWLHDRYNNPPIIITEIGAAFADKVKDDGTVDDRDRIAYIRDHLIAAHGAIAKGVDLKGCFIWALMDTFEFNLGYAARFGLVRVDRHTLKRTIKASGHWWGEVAAANGL
jgi:beta-glucosidase